MLIPFFVNVNILGADTATERPIVTCVKLKPDKLLDKYFSYKINADIVYKEDVSMIMDSSGFYHRYDVNSIDLPKNPHCSRCKNCA